MVVVLFVWFQVRPSAIRSICQSDYDETMDKLKRFNAGFCLIADMSEEQLKEINIQLGIIKSSWDELGNLSKWQKLDRIEKPLTCEELSNHDDLDEELGINRSFLLPAGQNR